MLCTDSARQLHRLSKLHVPLRSRRRCGVGGVRHGFSLWVVPCRDPLWITKLMEHLNDPQNGNVRCVECVRQCEMATPNRICLLWISL